MTDNNSIALATVIITGVLSALASLFAYLKSASADKKADHIKVAVDGTNSTMAKKIEDLNLIVVKLTAEKATAEEQVKGVEISSEVERQVAARVPPPISPASSIAMKLIFIFALLLSGAATHAQRFQAAVSTLADLLAYPLPNNNTNVMVAGRVTVGDGFEGMFTWFTGSTATADVGAVFATTRVGPSVPAGRWHRQFSGPVHTEWFSTAAASAANANVYINAAITFAASITNQARIVAIPSGTFVVADSIRPVSNMTLQLDPGTVLRGSAISPTATNPLIFVDSATGSKENIVITGGTLIGHTNVTGAQYGVAINRQTTNNLCRNIQVIDVTATEFSVDGFHVGGNPVAYPEDILFRRVRAYGNDRHGLTSVQASRLRIEDSSFTANVGQEFSCGVDIEPNSTLSVFDTFITGCYFASNRYRNLYVQRGNGVACGGVLIDDCISELGGNNGVTINICSRAEITNVRSRNNAGMGLDLGAVEMATITGGDFSLNTRSGIQIGLARQVKIIGATANQNTEAGIIINGGGLTNETAILNVLSGNTCVSNTLNGIRLAGAVANQITGNILTDNLQEGLLLTLSSSENNVLGNLISENGQTGDNLAANVQIDNGSNRNHVFGNQITKSVKYFYGTAVSGNGTSVTLPASASGLDSFYVGETAWIAGGTGAPQSAVVTAYNGTTKAATVAAFAPAPDATSIIEITGAKRPKWGILVGAGCVGNVVLGNKVFRSGETAEIVNAGTETILYLPIGEGGTSTNDLAKLPGDVGSAGGSFLLDNNHALKLKTAAGVYENAFGNDALDNIFITSPAGGDIKLRPNANDAISVQVLTGTGYILYRAVQPDKLLYTTGGNVIREATMGTGTTFTNGILTATGSGGTVTSVGLTMPAAFNVANSPVTGSNTLAVTINGTSSTEFLRRDGAWSVPGSGATLTNFSVGTMSPLFTVSAPTTYPLLAAVDPGAHRIYGWDDIDGAPVMMAIGAGLAYDNPTRTISATGGGGGAATNAYSIVMEEGVAVIARTNLNFIGAALTATDNAGAGRTDVTLSQSPASASVVGTGRTLTTTLPLEGGGTLAADRTFTLASSPTNSTVVVGIGRSVGTIEGVKGGGTLGQDLVLSADIPGLSADTAPDPLADFLMTYDTSGGNHKKALIVNLGGGTGLNKAYRTKVLNNNATTTMFTMTPAGNITGFGAHMRGSVVAKSASDIRTLTFTFVISAQRKDATGGVDASGTMLTDEGSIPGPVFFIGDNGGTYAGLTGADISWDTITTDWTPTSITAYYWVEQHGAGTITFFP